MVIEIKKSKRIFIIFGIIALLSVTTSILIIACIKNRQAIPYILISPTILFLVDLVYLILFLIDYIKKPYSYLIKFEDDYIELSKDREVYYKDIKYVLTDENDYIKYFVITSHNKIHFYHKSKEVNKFLINLLKSKKVKVIDSYYKNNANRCLAEIYWVKLEDGGRRNVPFTDTYFPQIVLDNEEMNEIAWNAYVINKYQMKKDRMTIADIILLSEKCPYELKIDRKFKLYEGNRLVAIGKAVDKIRSDSYINKI